MTARKKILVIEDEEAIIRFLRSSLHENGWGVLEARTGKLGIDLTASKKPDVILLDLGLPDQDGFQVLKAIRTWTSTPVIIISARGQETDRIAGLDGGADDYLTKPFGIAELNARLRVALRHLEQKKMEAPPVYEHDDLRVDLVAHRVWLREEEIRLSPIQYSVLSVLVRNAGRVVTQEQLIKEVWGEDRVVAPDAVRVFIHQIRHKIEPDPVRPRSSKPNPASVTDSNYPTILVNEHLTASVWSLYGLLRYRESRKLMNQKEAPAHCGGNSDEHEQSYSVCFLFRRHAGADQAAGMVHGGNI